MVSWSAARRGIWLGPFISDRIFASGVRDVIHDRPVRNKDALANPESRRSIKTSKR